MHKEEVVQLVDSSHAKQRQKEKHFNMKQTDADS